MLSTGLLRYPPGARMPPAMLFAQPSSKLHILQRAARLACWTLLLSFAASAVDLNGLVPIGPMGTRPFRSTAEAAKDSNSVQHARRAARWRMCSFDDG